MRPTAKHELASPEWIAALHAMILECLDGMCAAELASVDYSWSEIFERAPAHLADEHGRIVVHWSLRGGDLVLSRCALDADLLIECDYQGALPLARYDTRGEAGRNEQLARMAAALGHKGLLKISGSAYKRPKRFDMLHDAMARITQ